MNLIQKLIHLRKIKQELKTLELYKKTLKSSGTLIEGLKYITTQLDMTLYIVNNINRSLIAYTGN